MTADRGRGEHGWPKVRRWWRSVEWPVVISLGALAVVLGYVGFTQQARAAGEPLTGWDLLYLAFQLLTLESGMTMARDAPVPVVLQVARYLAPTVAGYTAVKALLVIFQEQIERLRALRLRDHVVVGGLGEKGTRLVESCLALGRRVVVIDEDENHGEFQQVRERGVTVVVGDATDVQTLRAARAHRAEFVFAVCGDDANGTIARRLRELIETPPKAPRSRPTVCFVYIDDPQLCNQLQLANDLERAEHPERSRRFELQYFDIFETGARDLLAAYPAAGPLERQDHPPTRAPHMLVIGLGWMGQALVVQAARQWQLERLSSQELRTEPLVVSVVDRQADAMCRLLQARYPQLADAWEFFPRAMDVASPEYERAAFLDGLPDDEAHSISSVYVCLHDDSQGLAASLVPLRVFRGDHVDVVVRTARGEGLSALFCGPHESLEAFRRLRPFPLLDRTLSDRLLTDEELRQRGIYEIVARAYHADWLREQVARGVTPEQNAFAVRWEELSEEGKASNRHRADDDRRKLEQIGCRIVPITEWSTRFAFTDDEVELLARMEHERWKAEREGQGWQYAPSPKDSERKTNPELLPWDDPRLPESTREYNRETIRRMPLFLAWAGLQILRVGDGDTTAAGPPAES